VEGCCIRKDHPPVEVHTHTECCNHPHTGENAYQWPL
ncbi:molybdenum cofactor biosynthesis protein MoaE, partial [Acinetobacter baumannii]|nr:molybdenum cofactor biosynthesis protein MoaE [Acinetobacter baumannii]